MKTTKEQRSEWLDWISCESGTCTITDKAIKALCDDADEAERLEVEVAHLRKRLEAFEECVKRLYFENLL